MVIKAPAIEIRSAFRLSLFLLLLLVLAGTPLQGNADTASTYALLRPVKIELVNPKGAGVRFSVPEAFLTNKIYRRGGRLQHFFIEVVYPEMMPLSMSDPNSHDGMNDAVTLPNAKKRFWIHIWVRTTKPTSNSDFIRLRVLSRPRSESIHENEQEFALFSSPGQDDYLVPKERLDDQTIYFDCWRFPQSYDPMRDGVGCHGCALIGDRMYLDFSFPRQDIHISGKTSKQERRRLFDCS